MNIFQRFFAAFKGKSGLMGQPGRWSFLFGGTAAGKFVNETTAMQTGAVYACVRILAEAVAGLPLHVYAREDDGSRKLNLDHHLYRLLHDSPNEEMTSFIFRETLMSHLLLWGNAYAQIIRDGHGRPMALWPLLPDRVEVCRTDRGQIEYKYQPEKGEKVTLRKDQVLHIPGLGFDGLVGYSPIAMAKNVIGTALATEEYAAKFFANGAFPGGILEHPGTVKDPKKLRESWQENFGGSANAQGVAVLEDGMKYSALSIPPEQAQFLQTRRFQITEIARIFRVPPHMIGDLEKSSFSNIEQQSLEFVKYTLDPWVVRWEQSCQQALFLPEESTRLIIRFNVDGLLRGDYKSRMDGYAVGRQNGWLSANDIRRLEKLSPLTEDEGGDLYLVNGNMKALSDANVYVGVIGNGGSSQ